MSAALDDYHRAMQAARLALVDLLAAEFRLGEGGSATAVTDAETNVAVVARDLTRAVDDLPRERQPRGWNT